MDNTIERHSQKLKNVNADTQLNASMTYRVFKPLRQHGTNSTQRRRVLACRSKRKFEKSGRQSLWILQKDQMEVNGPLQQKFTEAQSNYQLTNLIKQSKVASLKETVKKLLEGGGLRYN